MASTPPRAVLFALAGTALTPAERRFFARANPLGFILFSRNCESRAQTAALVRELRATLGRADAPVLIDMEGGKVARLKPPVWQHFPAAREFGRLYEKSPAQAVSSCFAAARLMGAELAALGINWNAMPVLDLPQPDADPIIGNRAYATNPAAAIDLARAAASGLMAAGVLPVIKHLPGHGRAKTDSHLDLPFVSASRKALSSHDFRPFAALAHLPLGMTAHLVYEAWDKTRPATCSPVIIEEVIRKEIGFDGLLMSDALEMHALKGSPSQRAKAALDAGCDIALCSTRKLAIMESMINAIPPLSPAACTRLALAERTITTPSGFEPAPCQTQLAELPQSMAA